MDKTIHSLAQDIYSVVQGNGGWTETIAQSFGEELKGVSYDRFNSSEHVRKYLSMSSLGSPCARKLWYRANEPFKGKHVLKGSDLLKFFIGDFTETLVLHLAEAAGHKVEGRQTELEYDGVLGHRDVVLDGVLSDVKSCHPALFEKYKKSVRENDSFGYVSQLSSYLAASQDDPLVLNKSEGALVFMNKSTGEIHVSLLDLTQEIRDKSEEVSRMKDILSSDSPPPRLDPVKQYKDADNWKLSTACTDCEFKFRCFPDIRTFMYSSGPVHLTHVGKEPRVPEYRSYRTEG